MAGVAVGLDFGAIMSTAAALDVDLELLAETLPDYEATLIAALNDDAPDASDGTDDH